MRGWTLGACSGWVTSSLPSLVSFGSFSCMLTSFPDTRAIFRRSLIGWPEDPDTISAVGDGPDDTALLQLLGQLVGQKQHVELLILF